MFEGIKAAIVKDRYAFFEDFFNSFYNVDVLGGSRISDRAWQASFNVAAGASPYASYACVDSWLTDFRGDLSKIDVPVLVMHGTEDRILPFDSTAARLPALIADCTLIPVEGGPAQHRLDLPRRSEQRSPRVHRREGDGGGVTAYESPSATSPNASLQQFRSVDGLPFRRRCNVVPDARFGQLGGGVVSLVSCASTSKSAAMSRCS